MTRIAPTLLVQAVDKNEIVIVDESTGAEVVISLPTIPNLIDALVYLSGQLDTGFTFGPRS